MSMPWWGSWQLGEGEARRWEIGPLRLLVERREREWRLSHEHGDDPLDLSRAVAVEADPEPLGEPEDRRRVPTTDDGRIAIKARLADRSVVFRPEMSLIVLPGEGVDLFVSSPVWVEVSCGAEGRALPEIPSYRPTDTWLGSTPIKGELCYASRTHCRLHVEELPMRPHRAITPVRVRNHGNESLVLDRMSVPLPNLSLYADEGDRLWTSAVELTRERDDVDLAKMRIAEEPPDGAKAPPLASPRRAPEAGGLVRAFAGLF